MMKNKRPRLVVCCSSLLLLRLLLLLLPQLLRLILPLLLLLPMRLPMPLLRRPSKGHSIIFQHWSIGQWWKIMCALFWLRFGGKRSTVAARARTSAQSQMLATVSRRAPPAAQRKERRGKDISGPCQAPLSRGSGILFFIIHHEIC